MSRGRRVWVWLISRDKQVVWSRKRDKFSWSKHDQTRFSWSGEEDEELRVANILEHDRGKHATRLGENSWHAIQVGKKKEKGTFFLSFDVSFVCFKV